MRVPNHFHDAPTTPIQVPVDQLRGAKPRRRFPAWGGVLGLVVTLLFATGFVLYGLPPSEQDSGPRNYVGSGSSSSAAPTIPGCFLREQTPVEEEVASELDPTKLEKGMRKAFEKARCAAMREKVEILIKSAKRTATEQARLFREEIKKRGSEKEARKWVLPPEESAHVKGTAVDVKPMSGAKWLERNGQQYGLCRTISREWWHFEHNADWVADGCPKPQ
ncbi:hypothetical protein JOF53_004795 [Crossiella equi]|uniref:D-alanyl-D-alanine carboxypeptidase-like core domain-containing protein n=1 Tax=Crossiella equi TaxID=130796 RepID=A0ABS5AH74_9PSEU|nr:M15 family metallopeptidase [Crossiella equi]MBP2475923.1 hypothetical protein [Crossiella equi]